MRTRRLILFILFALSLAAISRYGGTVSYSLFYAAVLVPVVSFVYLIYVYLRFRVHQEIQTRNIIAGQPVPYSFILKNEGLTVFSRIAVKMYADFSFAEEMPDNREFRLFPGDKATFHTRLTCRYRGEYKVGVQKIVITDFFGVFRLEYHIASYIEALVKPRIIKLEEIAGVPELAELLQNLAVRERNETDLTVREYVMGDPLKRIHWKATAKSGGLKVRNEIGVLRQKVMVLADAGRRSAAMEDYLPAENKVLEITIALLYYFACHNIRAEVLWEGKGTEHRNLAEAGQFHQLYEELSMLVFRTENHFVRAFREAAQRGLFLEGTALFFIVQRMDEELFTELSRPDFAGKIMMVYVVTGEDISAYVRQSSARMEIMAMKPEGELGAVLGSD